MALRTDLPKIPVTEEPTIWNGEMGKWAFLTSIPAGIVAGIGTSTVGVDFEAGMEAARAVMDSGGSLPEVMTASQTATINTGAITAIAAGEATAVAAGGYIGGTYGEAKMEDQQQEGKYVKDPTFWNTGILSNMMLVSFPAMVASAGLLAFGAIGAAYAITAIGGLVALGAAIYGGFEKKSQMQQEFNQALAIRDEQTLQQGISLQQSVSKERGISQAQAPYVNSVTPEESTLLEARMQQSQGQGMAAKIAEQRRMLEANPQTGV